jgi:hypothetical protein
MQAIITEMGPASDYAELLEAGAGVSSKKKVLVSIIVIAAVVAAVIIFAPHLIVTYTGIVSDRIEDNIDLPFVDDPEVIGTWKSVDFVESIDRFNPAAKRWPGELFLNELVFYENGRILSKNDNAKNGFWLKWTKGIVICTNDKTAEKYHIKEIDGEKYMFYEWKSGDYTIRHRKPSYYVLKRQTSQTPQIEPAKTKPAVDSAIQWLELVDKGDYSASWEEAADIFKNAATEERWAGMAKAVRQPLGKVVSRQVTSKIPTQTVPAGPDGEYVIIQFKTSFENKADSIETVTPMLDKNCVWRVTGYYIK